jgi:hypothetical protein
MNGPTIQQFPKVEMAVVPCPVDGCDVEFPVHGNLVVVAGHEGATPLFRMGVRVDTTDMELHAVEHGADITYRSTS